MRFSSSGLPSGTRNTSAAKIADIASRIAGLNHIT